MNAETGGRLTAVDRADELRARAEDDAFEEFGSATVLELLDGLADRDAVLARVEAVLSDARKIEQGAYTGAARQFAKAWGDVIDSALHPAPSETP